MEEVGGLVVDLRPYQVEAIQALDAYWEAGGGHPLAVLATATGKSLLIAKLIADLAARHPALRAMVLAHARELLEQNLEHLVRVWPGAPVGINSAALRRRDWHAPIVLANIQSVWQNPQRLGRRDLIVVDEAQLVPQRRRRHVSQSDRRPTLTRTGDAGLWVHGYTVSARQWAARSRRRQDLRRRGL